MTLKREDIDKLVKDSNRAALLYGPRGTGKTTIAQKSARLKQPIYSVTLTGEQSAASIVGHFIQEKGQFVWHDGPAAKAWLEGGLLIINEIDHASEDVSNILHAILDDFEVAQLTLPNNQTIKPKEGFRVIATMNGVPGDLNMAVLDRFSMILPVTMPSKEMLNSLKKDSRQACVNIYGSTGKKDPQFTYRMFRAFDELRESVTERMAAEIVVIDKSSAGPFIEALKVAA